MPTFPFRSYLFDDTWKIDPGKTLRSLRFDNAAVVRVLIIGESVCAYSIEVMRGAHKTGILVAVRTCWQGSQL